MSVTEPLAWTGAEDALWNWAHRAAGIDPTRVRTQTPRDFGEARGGAPKVTISLLSLLPTSQVGESTIPLVMQQRYTVLAGAGEVGVDFYPGSSLDPQRISVVAGAGDPTTVTAAALLAELQAELPAPFTAELDPSTVVLDLGNVNEVRVARGSEVTLDSDGPGALPWILQHDVFLPGPGTFAYSVPGPKAAPAGSTWTIAPGSTTAGWNTIDPNAADATDASSVLVTGTEAAPLFASGPVRDPVQLTTVFDTVSRNAIFSRVECVIIWRVVFRADGVSGSAIAASAAAQAMVFRTALLDEPMRRLGFRSLGTANFAPVVPLGRDESLGTLDVRFQGIMTGARTATPMRATKTTGAFLPA